jgi:hypothetical protein
MMSTEQVGLQNIFMIINFNDNFDKGSMEYRFHSVQFIDYWVVLVRHYFVTTVRPTAS